MSLLLIFSISSLSSCEQTHVYGLLTLHDFIAFDHSPFHSFFPSLRTHWFLAHQVLYLLTPGTLSGFCLGFCLTCRRASSWTYGLVPLLTFPDLLVVCLASLPIKWGTEPTLPQEEVMRFEWMNINCLKQSMAWRVTQRCHGKTVIFLIKSPL